MPGGDLRRAGDEHLARQVAHGGADPRVPELEADREGRPRRQRYLQRWTADAAPAFAGVVRLLRDDAREFQLVNQRRHRRPREPERLHELCPAQ